MRIALHADGGRAVGLGHLGRCVALAQAFAEKGAKPVFVDVAPECLAWLSSQGFSTAPLSARRWDLVIGDSYRLVRDGWKRLAAAGKRFMALDDVGSYDHGCDFVLNGHVYAWSLSYKAGARASLLLGSAFFPMRREFWDGRKTRRPAPARLARVLVTLGASDAAGIAERAAEQAARALPGAVVEVVLGPLAKPGGVPPVDRVIRRASVPSLRPLLERADLVVSGGGQTLYEAAYCGAPAVALRLFDNTEGNINGMIEAGAARAVGSSKDAGLWQKFRSILKKLDRSRAEREAMSRAAYAIVDGQGARRVAAAVLA